MKLTFIPIAEARRIERRMERRAAWRRYMTEPQGLIPTAIALLAVIVAVIV